MRTILRELIETAILALLIFLALQFSVENFRVEGKSMDPTLAEGEHLLVNKLVYFRLDPESLARFLPFVDEERAESLFPFHPPHRGEVIVFHFPGDRSRDFVKRVIGLPGEVVEVRAGQTLIDGQPLDEPYISHQDLGSMQPFEVPLESYFVMGDNRRVSNDSRDWGPVPEDDLIGRAWVSYWPLDRLQILAAMPFR